MHRALNAALRKYRYAILIGVDAPELRAADLRRALRLLRSGCDAGARAGRGRRLRPDRLPARAAPCFRAHRVGRE
jgi:hypothetical protein